jgi:uncharacterized protein YcbX
MNIPSPATLASIYRYPIKGLTPEQLSGATLQAGQTFPGDRIWAIENGPIGFDLADPKFFLKTKFLMLVLHERLATLQTRYDETSQVLSIVSDGAEVARGDLRHQDGRSAIEQFFAVNFAQELKGPPRLLASPNHSFCNVPEKVVSIVNLASVEDLQRKIGQPVNPLRFRANLHVSGWPAWHEFDLIGQTLTIGDARLKVVNRTVRCPAIDVDPDTGARDLEIPRALMQNYGHADCGVYAEVIAGGSIAEGDAIEITQPALL